MKIFIPLLVVMFSTASTLKADGDRGEEKKPKRIQLSDLAKVGEGEEGIVRFGVSSTYWISGGVLKGQARSFGIKPAIGQPDVRISAPVVGELADAMERFGFAPPNPGDRLAGATIEARRKVYVKPAPVNAPEKGPSYQFRMGDLKGFRIVSQSQAEDGADQPATAPGSKPEGLPVLAIEPGELKGPEAYEKIWKAWWSEVGPKPFPVPRVEAIDLRELTGEPPMHFESPGNEGTPFVHTIQIKKNHKVLVSGIHPDEGARETQGKWEMHKAKIFLFFEEGGLPMILFKEKAGFYLTNPWSKNLKTRVKLKGHIQVPVAD